MRKAGGGKVRGEVAEKVGEAVMRETWLRRWERV